jgi:hypothetical protein
MGTGTSGSSMGTSDTMGTSSSRRAARADRG